MIKPNELRIGNLVVKSDQIHSDSPQYGQITTVYVDKANVDYHYPLTWYKPIPLTEEWLLKFGFRMKAGKFRLPSLSGYHFFSLQNPFMAEHDGGFVPSVLCEYTLKYVHQLQNLYFALTGEELTIKE